MTGADAAAAEGRVSLLRGINVGGNHQIPMAGLRACTQSLGFDAVTTYIQSGNVVFQAARSQPDRSLAVEAAIAETFGWTIRVVERTHTELAGIVAEDPFPDADPATRLVMFLVDRPSGHGARGVRPRGRRRGHRRPDRPPSSTCTAPTDSDGPPSPRS